MPSTYNGIGTHYYGKRNVQTRLGQCRSCGRSVQLKSYDTRLWFVIFFVPIIPLGRKRIVDYCPACRRHYAVGQDKWETARQLEISGAMEKFRANPSMDTAIDVHRNLLEFHQVAEAAEFQKLMLTQFSDNAKIYAYLGAAQEHLGQQNQAAELYSQALKLRPDLPEARIGVAQGQIRAGRLDEARVLLDFLEKPGASQLYTLAPLETLARGYQAAGRHAEALELFGKIIEGLPKVTEHAGFRKTVKISEKALGRTTSILPKQKFSWKRFFAGGGTARQQVSAARALIIIGVIVALAVLGFVISNEYIRHHRKLYLVNGYSTPATVDIQGVGSVKNFRRVETLDLPEGHYHAVISGPVKEEIDFDVRDTYFHREFGDPLWLINVGGGALLKVTAATYSEHPQPATTTFYTGKTFEHFQTITHPFQTLPSSVQVDSGGSKTLISLDLYSGRASSILEYYKDKNDIHGALDFAEHWLYAHPDDDTVLELYEATIRPGETNRLDSFLRSGLTNLPVRTQWHRTYQELHGQPAERAALLTQYDELLRTDPTNSAYLYLRGRLETNRETAQKYFNDALKSDPKNPFAAYALAFDHAIVGDWTGAKPLIARAYALNPHGLGFDGLFYLTRLAVGEAPEIEKESREKLVSEPLNFTAAELLIEALAVQGKSADATGVCADYVARCRRKYGDRGAEFIETMQYRAAYAVGDFGQVQALAAKDNSLAGRVQLAVALVELGRVEEVTKTVEQSTDLMRSESLMFALAVAYRSQGEETAATKWEARGIAGLQKGSLEQAEVANLLKRDVPPTLAEAEGMAVAPQYKALIIAMLAQQYPQARTELAGLARKLNVGRDFPYYLVHRVTTPAP